MPKRVRVDNGSELKKYCIPLLKDFAVKPKTTSIKKTQSNAIVERVYQAVGDMLRTNELKDHTFDKIDQGVQFYRIFLGQILVLITQLHKPLQVNWFLVEICSSISYTSLTGMGLKKKQRLINKSNQAENKSRVDHDYGVNDQVLIYRDGIYRKLEGRFLGPYNIVQNYTNGTLCINVVQ